MVEAHFYFTAQKGCDYKLGQIEWKKRKDAKENNLLDAVLHQKAELQCSKQVD